MVFCKHCKSPNARYRYKNDYGTFYCGERCADSYFPVYIGQKIEAQISKIPPKKWRIILQTHREGGGVVPYTLTSFRDIINHTGGDVNAFDNILEETSIFRKYALESTALSDDIVVGKGRFDKNGRLNVYAGPTNDMLVRYLLNPFISRETFHMLLPAIKKVSEALYSEKLSLGEKNEAVKKYLENIVLDENLLDWGNLEYIVSNIKPVDPLMIETNRGKHKSCYDMFDSAFIKLKHNYKTPLNQFKVEKTGVEEISYTIVPKGVYLYRGYADGNAKNGLSTDRAFDWFAFDFFTCSFYAASNASSQTAAEWIKQDSGIAVFKTNRELRVLDLTKAKTVLYLQSAAPLEIRDHFLYAWKVTPSGKVKRRSSPSRDAKIVKWLCKQGYDGYIGIGFENLHDELFLCDAESKLKLKQDLKHNKDFRNDFVDQDLDPLQLESIVVEY